MTAEQESTVSFFRFEDLRIYVKALNYIQWLRENTSSFPSQHTSSLVEPFLKSAQGIALNVAEGSARNKAQFVYYLKMAKSSVRECVVYTEITANMEFFNEETKEYSRTQLMELTKMIGSLVASLQRSTPNLRDDDSSNLV